MHAGVLKIRRIASSTLSALPGAARDLDATAEREREIPWESSMISID